MSALPENIQEQHLVGTAGWLAQAFPDLYKAVMVEGMLYGIPDKAQDGLRSFYTKYGGIHKADLDDLLSDLYIHRQDAKYFEAFGIASCLRDDDAIENVQNEFPMLFDSSEGPCLDDMARLRDRVDELRGIILAPKADESISGPAKGGQITTRKELSFVIRDQARNIMQSNWGGVGPRHNEVNVLMFGKRLFSEIIEMSRFNIVDAVDAITCALTDSNWNKIGIELGFAKEVARFAIAACRIFPYGLPFEVDGEAICDAKLEADFQAYLAENAERNRRRRERRAAKKAVQAQKTARAAA